MKQTQFYADSEAFFAAFTGRMESREPPCIHADVLEAVAVAVDVPSLFTREVRRGTDFVDCSLKMIITIHFIPQRAKNS